MPTRSTENHVSGLPFFGHFTHDEALRDGWAAGLAEGGYQEVSTCVF